MNRLGTVALALALGLAACGDAASGNNGESPNNTSPNGNTNSNTNNVVANNQTTVDTTTSATACAVVDGDVQITSEADLEPYLGERCLRIGGDLEVTGEVTDLSGLNVTEVGGSLRITDSRVATAPFDQLERVGGSVVIARNPSLSTIDGFGELRDIEGRLVISEGPVTDVTGFGNLRRASAVLLSDLAFATNFSGLSRLSASTFAVYDLPMLTSLDDFPGMVTTDTLQLYRNSALTSAASLEGARLERLEAALNPQLSQLNLSFSTEARVEVLLGQNAQLEGIDTGDATRLRRLWTISNGAMTSVSAPNAATATDEIRVEQQPTTTVALPQLANFDVVELRSLPLADLTQLGLVTGSRLYLVDLDELLDLTGLEQLDRIGSTLEVSGNQQLSSILALQRMSRINVFRVRNNPNLDACQVLVVQLAVGNVTTVDQSGNMTGNMCPL